MVNISYEFNFSKWLKIMSSPRVDPKTFHLNCQHPTYWAFWADNRGYYHLSDSIGNCVWSAMLKAQHNIPQVMKVHWACQSMCRSLIWNRYKIRIPALDVHPLWRLWHPFFHISAMVLSVIRQQQQQTTYKFAN